jgi:hypothetical protein
MPLRWPVAGKCAAALSEAPANDRKLLEIVVTQSQLALFGHEVAFKLHAMRLFQLDVTQEQLDQVILAGLGVTLVIPQVAQILDWIEEAWQAHRKSGDA